MRAKGQAALEFLTTYGWAFTVVLTMIGSLSYFGVLDPFQFINDRCVVSSPFTCEEFIYGEDGFRLNIYNGLNENVIIHSFEYEDQGEYYNCPGYLKKTVGAQSRDSFECFSQGSSNFRFRYSSASDPSGDFMKTALGSIRSSENDFVIEVEYSNISYLSSYVNNTALNEITVLALDGNILYSGAYRDDSISVFDVSDPLNPVSIAYSDDNLRRPHAMGVYNDYLLVANFWALSGNYSFSSFDVSDPSNPVRRDSISDPGIRFLSFERVSDTVFAVGNESIAVINVSDPLNMNFINVHEDNTYLLWANGINLYGDYALISSRGYGSNQGYFSVFDVSDPLNIVRLESYSHSSLASAWDVVRSGDYAYVSWIGSGVISVFDVSSLPSISLIQNIENPSILSRPSDMYIYSNFLFVADRDLDKVVVFDISNPSNPVFSGEFSQSGATDGARYIVVDSGIIYLAAMGNNALTILEI